MPETTFTGTNGEVVIDTSEDGDVTITVKPNPAPPAQRTFRPTSRSPVIDVNNEPTGRGVVLEGGEDVYMGFFCKDSCDVEVKIFRRGADGNFTEEYSFVLTGLPADKKRLLLRTLERSRLPVVLGTIIRVIERVEQPNAKEAKDDPPVTFKAALSAPGEVSVHIGGLGMGRGGGGGDRLYERVVTHRIPRGLLEALFRMSEREEYEERG